MRKMREEIAKRLIFYQDFVNTKVLEFDEEMEEVQQRMDQIQKNVPPGFTHLSLKRSQKVEVVVKEVFLSLSF